MQELSLAATVMNNVLEVDRSEIRESDRDGATAALILPDLATCPECLRELFDPNDRRHLYPFTNCTHCGPRFSIIESLPYDRANTSMKHFKMCARCDEEYHDPNNRRFHAQPNACAECGPRLELWDSAGHRLGDGHDALLQAAGAVRDGQIVALKGIGGFQLIADARAEPAIRRLRARKQRGDKPFAVMFPDLDAVQDCCHVGNHERSLLLSPAAPIVLLKRISGEIPVIAASVAPRNPWLGIMLPYSPLHHLLLRALNFPIVATSGNRSDEPICTDEREALARLQGIADVFLVHNRPIVRHVDDSVVRLMCGREMIVRRARGYAPLPVNVSGAKCQVSSSCQVKSPDTVLAVGAHLKNAVALSVGADVFISQHLGDLETAQAFSAFERSVADLPRLYRASPRLIVHDLHPGYLSTQFARQLRLEPRTRSLAVQHHYAHVLSCMADNQLAGTALGVSWDDTGLGTDGTIWGGEFLAIGETSFDRLAHFREFTLPGGDGTIRQPRRCALGLLFEIFGADVFNHGDLIPLREFSRKELRHLEHILADGINSPVTSSAGRLFDAIASIIGLRQRVSFTGQAAMELEFAAVTGEDGTYPIEFWKAIPLVFDWQPMIQEILADLRRGRAVGIIAAKVHNTLVEVILAVAHAIGETHVVLSGGCFQNQYLTERTIRRLRDEGFVPHWHRRVPPNDGGIALGQVMAALRASVREPEVGARSDGQRHETAAEWSEPVLP